jgi:DNA-binding transcriptional LysR family regulator
MGRWTFITTGQGASVAAKRDIAKDSSRARRLGTGDWASLRDLEVLNTVIEAKSTTLAASRLGISQPAVSRTLAQMEQRSGRTLFRREGRSLSPTADALALYGETRSISESLQRVRAFDWAENRMTPLRLATPPTMAHCFLDRLAARFVSATPGVTISIEIVTTPQVFEMVADRKAEIGLADVTTPTASLERIVFRRSAFACAMTARHPLARKSRIVPADLDGQNLVALVKRNPARATIDRLFSKAGVRPNIVVETSNAVSALDYVGEGVGVALVNPFPVALTAKGIVLRPFEPRLEYDTAFFLSAGDVTSALARRFIEYVREHQPAKDAWSVPVG